MLPGGEENPVSRDVLGGDHRALLVDLLDRRPVAAPGGRGDGRDPVQRRDGEPAGGGGLGEVRLVQRLLAGVVAVDHLAAERGGLRGARRLALHVVEVVDVGDEGRGEPGAVRGLPAHAGELVPGTRLEPRLVDVVRAEGGVRAREVGAVHLGRVDVREDVLEVAALGRDGHAAVDQRAAAHAAALVHLDPRELLGVEDTDVALHLLVDPEAHEIADRLAGGVREPGGALVRIEHPREDLAVRARRVPAAAHLHDVGRDPRLRQAQRRQVRVAAGGGGPSSSSPIPRAHRGSAPAPAAGRSLGP